MLLYLLNTRTAIILMTTELQIRWRWGGGIIQRFLFVFASNLVGGGGEMLAEYFKDFCFLFFNENLHGNFSYEPSLGAR